MNGIHHVTAIAGNPSKNLAFYTKVLGLRLVKKTVNFDDPTTYHLYYGDEVGRPGTILTFFPWEHASAGRAGIGMTQETAFRVPIGSMSYWTHRFVENGLAHGAFEKRLGETRLPFNDPDGLALALVGILSSEDEHVSPAGSVPPEHAIRGFHSVTLLLAKAGPTSDILSQVFGYQNLDRDNSLLRLAGAQPGPGNIVDIREAGEFLAGRMGHGSVHHIAFRATDDAQQAAMANKLRTVHHMNPTEQIDRQYFRSVYFREPGGILFEIATDQPGFPVDEPLASLGTELKLPAFLEPRRRQIEATLPPLGGAG
jgi:glyoxalase family protein